MAEYLSRSGFDVTFISQIPSAPYQPAALEDALRVPVDYWNYHLLLLYSGFSLAAPKRFDKRTSR